MKSAKSVVAAAANLNPLMSNFFFQLRFVLGVFFLLEPDFFFTGAFLAVLFLFWAIQIGLWAKISKK